jgi:hypothetical protein
MDIKEQLIKEIESLPTELVNQALALIHSLKNNIPQHQKTLATNVKKVEFIRSIRGKYAHLQTSSEQFAQRKQAEIEWENRNS